MSDFGDDLDDDDGGMRLHIGAKIAAKLSAGIDTLAQRVAEQTDAQRRSNFLAQQAAALQSIRYRLWQNGQPVGGVLVLDFDTPALGRVWEVRSWNAGGVLPTDVRGGVANLYKMAATANMLPAGANLSAWLDTFAALPNVKTHGAGNVVVNAGEVLFVVFTGATNAVDYGAVIEVTDRIVTPTERAAEGT